MTDIELGWMAGIFDGEGCIKFRRDTGVALQLTSTDKDITERFYELAQCGTIYVEERQTGKDVYVWMVGNKRDVLKVLTPLIPYLCHRRQERAHQALIRLENNRSKKTYS